MLDQATKTELDEIQLAALRKADRVCFYHRDKPDASGFASYISAVKENKPDANDPFAREQVVLIQCEWRLRDYQRDNAIPYGSDQFRAFASIAKYNECWATIASLLRAGDNLILSWSRGGWNTEAMANANPPFFGDTLELKVERGTRADGRVKVLTFHIDTSICEDNLARMIRRA